VVAAEFRGHLQRRGQLGDVARKHLALDGEAMVADERHQRPHMAAIIEMVGDAVEACRRRPPDLLGERQFAVL
jgi:hypothetical protein